jgi:hypothetical protein
MPRRECYQLLAPKDEKRLGGNEDRAGPRLDESFEGGVKVALSAGLYDENLFSKRCEPPPATVLFRRRSLGYSGLIEGKDPALAYVDGWF